VVIIFHDNNNTIALLFDNLIKKHLNFKSFSLIEYKLHNSSVLTTNIPTTNDEIGLLQNSKTFRNFFTINLIGLSLGFIIYCIVINELS